MKKITVLTNKIIAALIYGYIGLPFIMFAFGWLRWYLAVPVAGLAIAGLVLCVRDSRLDFSFVMKKENIAKIVLVAFIIMLWVRVSGIAGLSYQNTDHYWRNGIFRMLIEYQWPVRSDYEGVYTALVYDIGYWLPAAFVGKLLGMVAAEGTLLVWTWIGGMLVFLMLCGMRRRVNVWPMLAFILFAGLDLIGSWLVFEEPITFFDIVSTEAWVQDVKYIGHSAQLFWMYNQAVPAWVCTLLLLMDDNRKNILYACTVLIISSHVAFVGVIPIVAACVIKSYLSEHDKLKNYISVQNIVGVCVVMVVSLLYFATADNAQVVAFLPRVDTFRVGGSTAVLPINNLAVSMLTGKPSQITFWMMFCLVEFLIYGMLVYRYQKGNPLYYAVLAWLMICPTLSVANRLDFCIEAGIPGLVVIFTMLIDAIDCTYKSGNKLMLCLIILLVLLGTNTSLREIHRSYATTVAYDLAGTDYRTPVVGDYDIFTGQNYASSWDSFFFNHMVKK